MAHSRKIVIGGNWKMNLLPSDVSSYASKLNNNISCNSNIDILIAPPYIMLSHALETFGNSGVFVAAQNVSEHDFGAYTGEVSAVQLHALGVSHVIVGHSERRTLYGETDEVINKKVLKVLEHSMTPVLCVGENEVARNAGHTEDIIASQLHAALNSITSEDICRIIIAYEPVWAIGTGNTATAQQAEEVCSFIREQLRVKYGHAAYSVSIIYGGSMNTSNCAELMACENIDGGLIGGASLDPESFAAIISTAKDSIQEG